MDRKLKVAFFTNDTHRQESQEEDLGNTINHPYQADIYRLFQQTIANHIFKCT